MRSGDARTSKRSISIFGEGQDFDEASWKVSEKFSIYEIRVSIKDGLPSSIKDELVDNQEDYNTLTHEDWCDFLSTIEVKDNK